MIYNHLERIRREIESVKQSILDVKVIKSMDDYYHRTGYLMGLQKSIELMTKISENLDD